MIGQSMCSSARPAQQAEFATPSFDLMRQGEKRSKCVNYSPSISTNLFGARFLSEAFFILANATLMDGE